MKTSVPNPYEYIAKRHLQKTVVHTNQVVLLTTVGIAFLSLFFYIFENSFSSLISLCPLIGAHFLLKQDKWELAGMIQIITLNVNVWITTFSANMHLGNCFAIIVFPYVSRQVTSYRNLQIFNGISNCTCLVVNLFLAGEVPWEYLQPVQRAERVATYFFAIVVYAVSFWVSEILGIRLRKAATILQSNTEKSEEICKELVKMLDSKDHFLQSFSHEIKQYLKPINESIDRLLQTVKDEPILEVLRNARLGGKMIMTFVNNLMDAFMLQSERVEFSVSKVSPSEILKHALAIMRESLKKKELFFRAMIRKEMPSCLFLDSAKILQILLNLISNSMKFTSKNGKILIFMDFLPPNTDIDLLDRIEEAQMMLHSDVEYSNVDSTNQQEFRESVITKLNAEIFDQDENENLAEALINNLPIQKKKTLSEVVEINTTLNKRFTMVDVLKSGSDLFKPQTLRALRGFLKFQITDTGSGISSEQLDQIFSVPAHPFGKNTTMKHEFSLWVCKQLCIKMGGDMKAYSKMNKGTSIIFYIPVNHEDTSPEMRITRVQKKSIPRALVVDDELYNRELYSVILRKQGVEVVMACDGKEALETYTKEPEATFDFVFMDINMPRMDGVECVREMRRHEKNSGRVKHTDVFFISANYELSNLESSQEMKSEFAVTKFIRKPIDMATVKNIVSEYVTKLEANPIEVSTRRRTTRRETAPAINMTKAHDVRNKLLDSIKSQFPEQKLFHL